MKGDQLRFRIGAKSTKHLAQISLKKQQATVN